MKAWVQRVTEASVTIEGEKVAEIGLGYLVLLGVGIGDTEKARQLHRYLNPARTPFVLAKLVPQLPMAKCTTDEKWLIVVNEDLTLPGA